MSDSSRSHDPDTPQPALLRNAIVICAIAISIGFTMLLVRFVIQNSYFFGDDYFGFLLLAEGESLSRVLLAPIGSHVAPLHRLVNAVLFHTVGLRFGIAVAVLAAFHGLSIVYLYATLQLFKRTRANVVLTCWYSAYPLLWSIFAWWTAGLHRAPFAAASAMATYYYFRWANDSRLSHLLSLAVCYLFALGFYSKALLLPFCLVGLDVACQATSGKRVVSRPVLRRWLSLAVLLALGGMLFQLAANHVRMQGSPSFGILTPKFLTQYVLTSFSVLAHSLFGIAAPYAQHQSTLLVSVLCPIFVGYTLVRAPSTSVAWGALTLNLVLHFLVIGTSARTLLFGLDLASEPRYFYELALLVALFVGVVVHAVPKEAREAQWFITSWRKLACTAILIAAMFTYGVTSYRSSIQAFWARSRDMHRTMLYVRALERGFEPLRRAGNTPKVVDGPVPVFVTPLDFRFRRHSQLLKVLGLRAEFVPEHQAAYRITEDGHIVEIHRP